MDDAACDADVDVASALDVTCDVVLTRVRVDGARVEDDGAARDGS